MFDLSIQCYISNSKAINPLVQEKKFVKVFTVTRHGGHIGHVTLRFVQIFTPSAQGGSKRNLVTFGPVGYRRS